MTFPTSVSHHIDEFEFLLPVLVFSSALQKIVSFIENKCVSFNTKVVECFHGLGIDTERKSGELKWL
jgi:hypothetical protein